MKHDELLAKIDKNALISAKLFGWVVNRKESKALRAVVELHRPNEDNCCTGCPYDLEYDGHFFGYPCDTIQAIEKEIGL